MSTVHFTLRPSSSLPMSVLMWGGMMLLSMSYIVAWMGVAACVALLLRGGG